MTQPYQIKETDVQALASQMPAESGSDYGCGQGGGL
jgi:hypothetical protein